MDLIVAVLLYIGALSPGQTPTEQLILNNESVIEHFITDEDFLREYESQRTADHIGMLDLNEGD